MRCMAGLAEAAKDCFVLLFIFDMYCITGCLQKAGHASGL